MVQHGVQPVQHRIGRTLQAVVDTVRGRRFHRPIGAWQMLQAVGPGRSDIACVNGDAVAGRQLRYAAPDRTGGRYILISEIGGERVAVHLSPKAGAGDRKSVGYGKSGSVRVAVGGSPRT